MQSAKVECINPNTGGRMNIDADTHSIFSKAIRHSLKGGRAISFTNIVEGVKKYLKENRIPFKGSVSWYAITVKNDMESRGHLESFTEKGKKLHRLKGD